MNTLTKGLIASAAFWVMASCGGGGGGDLAGGGIGGTGISGGIGGSGISQGPITGFGSVYVNGIKFEEAGATIKVEKAVALRTDLKIGMVVKIAWERDTAGVYTAKSIVYNDDVQGPVAAKGVDAAGVVTFTVLGQTVVANPTTTAFDKVTADALANGNIVEVSGLKGAAGVLYATRVEKKTAAAQGETFEMKGVVTNLNPGATTFMLGTATVNYSGVIPMPIITAGDCVEIKSMAGLTNGQLIASTIESEDSCTPGGSVGQELALKGYPSAIDKTANTFTVNGQQVNYSNATFPPGKTEENLSGTAIVEVEGSLSDAVLIARKISFEVEGELNVTGRAQGPITNDTLMMATTPATFTVNNLTVYEDDSASPIPNFGRASIEKDHILKVYYHTGTTGIHVATRIKREG